MSGLEMIVAIVVINIVYVSLFTLRIILVMKSQQMLASLLSMVEVFIYLIGLSLVLDNIDNPWNLLAYCIGYGSGVYLGGKIESWLALGYVTLEIIVDREETNLPHMLRQQGCGVTSWHADGRDGGRMVMTVLVKRSNERRLTKKIQEHSPKAFIISYEPRYFRGGFWTRRISR